VKTLKIGKVGVFTELVENKRKIIYISCNPRKLITVHAVSHTGDVRDVRILLTFSTFKL